MTETKTKSAELPDAASIEKAVALQQQSYALLRSLTEPLDTRVLAMAFDVDHGTMSFEDAAFEWLRRNGDLVPSGTRERGELRAFANMFASYLEASFDVVVSPGERLESDCNCSCPCCSYLAAAPHLRPKKLASIDKHRARLLQIDYVKQLASQRGATLTSDACETLASTAAMREPLAAATNARELVRRMNGIPTGPEVLALWRSFAWTPTGAPKKDFRLDAAMLMSASETVAEAVDAVAREKT